MIQDFDDYLRSHGYCIERHEKGCMAKKDDITIVALTHNKYAIVGIGASIAPANEHRLLAIAHFPMSEKGYNDMLHWLEDQNYRKIKTGEEYEVLSFE